MKQWVISVAGIAILSVLADVILPNGQTKKYIKTVIGLVVTLAVVCPVVNFFSQNKNVQLNSVGSVSVQNNYLQYASGCANLPKLKTALENAGFCAPEVCFNKITNEYSVVFKEEFSDELHCRALAVAASFGSEFSIEFYWAGN